MRLARVGFLWVLLVAVTASRASAQLADATVQIQMAEAQRHFNALEYEQTVPPLDRVIAQLQPRPLTDDVRSLLIEAFTMRARSLFYLNNTDGARRDFVELLKLNPSADLGGQVNPRVTSLLEEVRAETVGTVQMTVTPPTATVLVDDVEVRGDASVSLPIGPHVVRATQPGYTSDRKNITVVPGPNAPVVLMLTRSAALLTFVTSPAEVEVIVDGRSRGQTRVRPLTDKVRATISEAGVDAATSLGLLDVSDIGAGQHTVEFRRDCFTTVSMSRSVTELNDYIWGPVILAPAMATLNVTANALKPRVFLDGEAQGQAPFSGPLCEGQHVVELRGATGRYVQKVDAKAGQRIDVVGTLRPAFALVASTQTSLNADLRGAIERTLEPARSLMVFAPPAESLNSALRAEGLTPDWLGYDANRRPFGVSAEVTPAMRRDLSSKLAKAFDAQGIAAVTAPLTANRTRLVVTLLSAGMADPDVVEINLDQPETVASALAQIDRNLSFFTHSIGVSAVDVVDGAGPVIVSVDAAGPAAQAGLQTGDTVLSVDGKPVVDSAALTAAVEAHAIATSLSVGVRDRTGADKQFDVAVLRRPRLLGIADQTLLMNRTVALLRAQLASSSNADEQAVIRLNLAAALTRLEAWSEARAELQQVKLPDGPGVGSGTVQYLLGLCAARLGDGPGARAAFTAAGASSNLLTEDGPPVRDLAEARLAELNASASAR